MKKLILLTVALVVFTAYSAPSAIFTVGPAEDAFVVRNDTTVRSYGPGLGFRIPYLEKVGFIATRIHRQTVVSIDGRLLDGSNCVVDATLQYRINDPLRAFEWRRAQGLDVSKETSAPYKRSDYSEPTQVFRTALESMMKAVSTEKAATGVVEDWISDFSRSRERRLITMELSSPT